MVPPRPKCVVYALKGSGIFGARQAFAFGRVRQSGMGEGMPIAPNRGVMHNSLMRPLSIIFVLFLTQYSAIALAEKAYRKTVEWDEKSGALVETTTNVSQWDLTKRENFQKLDSFYDPQTDYSVFTGRVSDRDESGNVFKVESENMNSKFFRAGDYVEFTVPGRSEDKKCGAYVRSTEEHYFVLYLKDLYPCWEKGEYFRRGTILKFKADVLAKRVRDASLYRIVLIKRRQDFLKQLNEINHFLWSYDQQRMLRGSEYDKKIEELRLEKQKAMEAMITKKKDHIHLQKELMYRLDVLDQDLEFYRVERNELALDRWNEDHHLGLPVGERPQALKQRGTAKPDSIRP